MSNKREEMTSDEMKALSRMNAKLKHRNKKPLSDIQNNLFLHTSHPKPKKEIESGEEIEYIYKINVTLQVSYKGKHPNKTVKWYLNKEDIQKILTDSEVTYFEEPLIETPKKIPNYFVTKDGAKKKEFRNPTTEDIVLAGFLQLESFANSNVLYFVKNNWKKGDFIEANWYKVHRKGNDIIVKVWCDLEKLLAKQKTEKDEVKSDCPSILYEYCETLSCQLHYNLKRVIAAKKFKHPNKDRKWHTGILDSQDKRLRAIAELRPADQKSDFFIQTDELLKLQKRMAEEIAKMDDLTADVFDSLTYVWLRKAKGEESSVTITADDILRMRGIKPKKSGHGRRGGFEQSQRREVGEHINILDNTWIKVFEIDIAVEEESPNGRKRRYKKNRDVMQSRAILVSDRMGQLTLSGEIEPYAWRYKLGTVFSPFIFGPGRETALLSFKALQYDPYRQIWEKRLTRYLTWQGRIRYGKEHFSKPYTVKTLLNAIDKNINKRYPSKSKERLEKALDTLKDDGIIANWHYDAGVFNETIVGKRGWGKKWLEWPVFIEPVENIINYYNDNINQPKRIKRKRELPKNKGMAKKNSKKSIKVEISKLRDIRKTRKLTLERAASEIGISISELSRIERGKRKPNKVILEKIENWLSIG